MKGGRVSGLLFHLTPHSLHLTEPKPEISTQPLRLGHAVSASWRIEMTAMAKSRWLLADYRAQALPRLNEIAGNRGSV